jgi:hypothetical protein
MPSLARRVSSASILALTCLFALLAVPGAPFFFYALAWLTNAVYLYLVVPHWSTATFEAELRRYLHR